MPLTTEQEAARYRYLRDCPRVEVIVTDADDETLKYGARGGGSPEHWEALFADEAGL